MVESDQSYLQIDPEPDEDVSLNIEDEQSSVTDLIEDNELAQLILKFLRRFDLWFFNATRIKKWGSKQHGFASFSEYSIKEIKLCLQMLVRLGRLRTKKSKKGTTLYAIE
ncbi:MAG: hypothetical protein QNJ37_19450 [Crocosphaera sp.]|nr:hypothetical protein [Crocosphaera sp.]